MELPVPFSGDGRQSFVLWTRQFEIAVGALMEGDGALSCKYELA